MNGLPRQSLWRPCSETSERSPGLNSKSVSQFGCLMFRRVEFLFASYGVPVTSCWSLKSHDILDCTAKQQVRACMNQKSPGTCPRVGLTRWPERRRQVNAKSEPSRAGREDTQPENRSAGWPQHVMLGVAAMPSVTSRKTLLSCIRPPQFTAGSRCWQQVESSVSRLRDYKNIYRYLTVKRSYSQSSYMQL